MKTDRADKTDKSVALHARKYADPASRKPIILHGLFGCGVNWRSIAARLSACHEVFCPDLRNHARSAWHDQMGYAAMAGAWRVSRRPATAPPRICGRTGNAIAGD